MSLKIFTITLLLPFLAPAQAFPPFEEIESSSTACSVDTTLQTGSPQPLFIRPGTSNFFHPSNRQGQLQLTANQNIELFCNGPWNFPAGAPNSITATCVNGQTFSYNNATYTFNSFRCRSWPTWTTRRSSTKCFDNGILVDVGYQVESRWLHVYTVCHDLVLETNWYVKHHLGPVADANQRNVNRPDWSQAAFYTNRNVNHLYTRPQQRRTIADILGDQAAADGFVESEPSDVFLARGHLAAMTDFLLATEQRATFHFLDAAPQWQTFNALNWMAVELSVRRLAGSRGLNLDVFTGTYGVQELWNKNNTMRGIYLDWPAGRIPAPKIFYKVIVDQKDMSGIVLLGVNNPHLTLAEIQRDGYIVCPDVSDQISYVSWQKTNLRRGYSYACEIHEFARAVPHVTELRNNRYRLLV